ncbi:MAG: sigma-70 family RNA polymerase sigma factor [Anaerovoracaceae bacterium]
MLSKYEKLTFEELADLAQNGDEFAEEFLIRAFKGNIFKKTNTYFIMGADSQDVVQEAMIGLFKAIKNYEPNHDASFKTFADLCMNRQIISAVKAANRNKHVPLNTSISLHKPIEALEGQTYEETITNGEDTDPEAMAVLNDVVKYIDDNNEKIFSNLETKVWKEFVQGKTYEEIAKELDKNIKSVYNAMERTKKKILQYLAD